jgi:hypothetical protein
MFRLLFLSFIALRVVACPVCCQGAFDNRFVSDVAVVHHSCGCSGEQNATCDDDGVPPAKSPCPCETGCDCQVTAELSHRTIVEFQLAVDLAPLSLETLDLSEVLVSRFEHQPRSFDLLTGRSVRVAHSSWLL